MSFLIDVPMTFKKRGGRKVIVLPDGTQGNPAPKATIDNTMIKAIARAFRWQKLLENGTYGCLEDIARGGEDRGFVCQPHRPAGLAGAGYRGCHSGWPPAGAPDAEGPIGSISSPVGKAETPVYE